jgi:CYTH domain-containing protein
VGIEIERKYLVDSDEWRDASRRAVHMRQGYFRTAPESTVRVRLVRPVDNNSGKASRGQLTVKGRPSGRVRPEFEYTIPPGDVERMLDLFCGARTVEKVRHTVAHRGDTWVVDVFEGANEGLVLAEIELDAPDASFSEPAWLGSEVSDDPSYTNGALARTPIQEREEGSA